MGNYHIGVNPRDGAAPSPITGVATGISALIGNFASGPVNEATLVTSLAEFEAVFGTESPSGCTGHEAGKSFFQNAGNAALYVIGIRSSAAAKASLTIQDRQGSPANTLKIEWRYPGLDGENGAIDIADDNILSTVPAVNIDAAATSAKLVSIGGLEVGSWVEFDNGTNQEQKQITSIDAGNKTIYWTGGLVNAYTTANGSVKSQEFKISVHHKNNFVKTYEGLSMVDDVTFHVEKVLNNDSTGKLTVTDLKSSDAGLTDMPAVTAKTSLTGGADGLSDVTASDYIGSASLETGLYAMNSIPGLFRFCCDNPKLTDADVDVAWESLVQAMLDYANTDARQLQTLASIAYDKTVTEAGTMEAKYEGRKLSIWYGWGHVSISGGTTYIPMTAGNMGRAVRKDYESSLGTCESIGNKKLNGFIGLEKSLTRTQIETLKAANINVCVADNGIRTWGARSQSVETRFRFIEDSEYHSTLIRDLTGGLQQFVFAIMNDQTMKAVHRVVDSYLRGELQAGRIVEYSIEVTNPEVGLMRIAIAYRRSDTAESIDLPLTATKETGVIAA